MASTAKVEAEERPQPIPTEQMDKIAGYESEHNGIQLHFYKVIISLISLLK